MRRCKTAKAEDLNEVEKIRLTPIMFYRIRLTLDYGACFFGVRKVVPPQALFLG